MDDEFEKRAQEIQDRGLKRVLAIVKLCLTHVPRLAQEIESSDPELHKKATAQARLLLQRINTEIETASESGEMKIEEFNAALNNPLFFTPEEWKSLSVLPSLLQKYRSVLFSPPRKKRTKTPRQFPKA